MLSVSKILDGDLDEIFQQAVEVVVQYERASASLLQRRLGIGYARAARVMDQLEAAGVVAPHEGSKPTEVLVRSYDDFIARGGKLPKSEEEEVFAVPENYKVPTGLKLSGVENTPWGK